jgi:ABC-type lipoprotein export system ATPase subunit
MQIHLKNVIPEPLAETTHNENSIWGHDISFSSDERIILNAVSGKGKSTFISFLSGTRQDFKGHILFNNKTIKDFELTDWIKLRQSKISTVYQDLKLFDNLTIEENILIKNNLTNHFNINKIRDYINKAGLSSEINKKAGYLSYGQKQRVAIIRALAQPFKLLLLDEPFSHLDLNNQQIMIEIIEKEISTNQSGFILTSLNDTNSIQFDKELYL